MLNEIKAVVASKIATKSVTTWRTEEKISSELFIAKFTEYVNNFRMMEEVDNWKTSYTFFGDKSLWRNGLIAKVFTYQWNDKESFFLHDYVEEKRYTC